MTELPKTTHPLRILAGSVNCPLAEEAARRLDVALGNCTAAEIKCADYP